MSKLKEPRPEYTIDDLDKGKTFTVTHPANTIAPIITETTIVGLYYPDEVRYTLKGSTRVHSTRAERFLAAINEHR